MELKPIGERVIIKLIESGREETTLGGIILTSNSKSSLNRGEILALGYSDNMREMKIGDEIYFERGKEVEIDLNGEKYHIVNFRDIYAVKER